jgi:preprotein translocase subunit SecG
MNTFLTIVHIIVCVFLILVVLLQAGKGGGMGIAFGGGGSQTVFGSSGAGNFLTRLTSITAVIFMITSLVLAHNSSAQDSKRLQRLEGKKAAEQEAEKARLDKLKADIEKQGAAKSGQSAAPTAPASGAAGAPAAAPDLPLKLTAPKMVDEATKAAGKGDSAKGAAKPAAGTKPAKDAAAKEGAAAPGEKPAKKRKKAPAEGETGATPAPAPAAAPPPAE